MFASLLAQDQDLARKSAPAHSAHHSRRDPPLFDQRGELAYMPAS